MSAAEDAAGGLCIEHHRGAPPPLDDGVLAALAYGGAPPPAGADRRIIHVGLETADGEPAVELWRSGRPATTITDGPIRAATQGELLFGCLEVDERETGGLTGAAEAAYRRLVEFQRRQPQAHLLRVWNHFDAINEGEGDAERYRQFCVGRARGLAGLKNEQLPAGTAVGRRGSERRLQVCWLAARRPGRPVENPRQVRAYHYPRRYGPTPPSFSRAMLLPDGALIVSGTASIVGHESRHDGDLEAQLQETLANLRELRRSAGPAAPAGGGAFVKAYLRSRAGVPAVRKALAGLGGTGGQLLLLADICRRELLIEIECSWV